MRERGLEYAWRLREKMALRRQHSARGASPEMAATVGDGAGKHTQSRAQCVKSTLSLPPAFGAPGSGQALSPYSAPVVRGARATSPAGQAASPVQIALSTFPSTPGVRAARAESPRGFRECISDEGWRNSEEWCTRHHITWSMGNTRLPPNVRVYFDALPQVTIRSGRYNDAGMCWPDSGDDTNRHQQQRRWQWYNYPPPKVALQHVMGERQRAPPVASYPEELTFRDWNELPAVEPSSSSSHAGGAASDRPTSQEQSSIEADSLFVCACGNVYMPDALFCRKCGRRRLQAVLENEQDSTSRAETPVTAKASQSPVPMFPRRFNTTGCSDEARQSKIKAAPVRRTMINAPAKRRYQVQSIMANLPHAGALKHFMMWIEAQHSHVVRIWRILDQDGNMRLSKQEFTRGLHALHYRGDYNSLWSLLDRDHSGWVSFIHFAAEPAIILAHFKKWLDDGYGGARAAFCAFDKSRDGTLTFNEFAQALKTEGFEEQYNINARTLFDLIDDAEHGEHQGNRRVSLKEFTFLDRWECPEYLWAEPDEAAATEFRRVLGSRHRRNMLLAWRKTLDQDSSMRVSYHEFTLSCKNLARSGVPLVGGIQNIAALFRAMDENASGWLSLREFDMTAYTLLTAFCDWVKREHGKPSQSIKTLASDSESLAWKEFKKAVQDGLGFSKDEALFLFEGLSMESKQGTIVPTELVFLDKWDFKAELEEELAWDEMVKMQKRQLVVMSRPHADGPNEEDEVYHN